MKAVIAVVALVFSTSAFANLSNIKHAENVQCADVQKSLKINSNLNLYIGNASIYHYTFFTTDSSFCDKGESIQSVYVTTADEDNCRLSACVK